MKRNHPQSPGFTLMENLMALTLIVVIAIPLVGLIGMAATARSSADQRREAAQLARQIAAELSHSTAELGAPKAFWEPLIAVRPISGKPGDWPYLTTLPSELGGRSIYLAYGADFQPAGEISASDYVRGIGSLPAAGTAAPPLFAIRIEFAPAASQGSLVDSARILRATVTVGSPAVGPAVTRREERFATLIHVPDPGTGT